MATTLAYRVVQTAGIGRAVSDRSEMPQHAAEDAMPTLGHELLRVHRFVVEIRFERQSPQRAVASFSDCAMPWSNRSEARAAGATTATTAPPETGSNPYERTFRMRGITSLRSPSELDRFRYVKSCQPKRSVSGKLVLARNGLLEGRPLRTSALGRCGKTCITAISSLRSSSAVPPARR